MPEKHELTLSQPWRKCSGVRFGFARALLLLSLAAIIPASVAAEPNYNVNGFGTNYDQSGFPAGTTNFGQGSTAAGTGANEKAKEGKNAADRARNLGDMGNQIGKDYGKLIPQMGKAQQQDAQSGSGSSHLSSLMSQRYLPPQPYRKPFEQLGLKTNNNLYVDGPPIRQRLLNEARSLSERSVQMFADASKANEAANSLGKLSMESAKRGMRMGVARAPGSSSDQMATNSHSGSLNSSGSSSHGGVGGLGGTQKVASADISGKSAKGLESAPTRARSLGELAGVGDGNLGNFWPEGKPGGSKPTSFSVGKGSASSSQDTVALPEKGSKLKSRLAYLDGMFDTIEASPGSQPGSATSEIRPADSSLEIGPDNMQVLNDLALPEAVPVTQATEFQGSGSLLEEVSLFERVHQTLKRAERRGRLVRSDQ